MITSRIAGNSRSRFSVETYRHFTPFDFDVLENVFYQKSCKFGHGQLPDFDLVQGISDVIDGTNAVAEKYPEFQTALTQRKLADIRE